MNKLRALVLGGLTLALAACNNSPFAIDRAAPLLQEGVKADQDPIADGAHHFSQQEYALAALSYQRAIERNPGVVEAWLGLAASYDELRRFDLSDRAYAQAARLAAGSATVLNNHGYSLYLRGDVRQARKLFLEARAREPDNPAILNNLRLVGG